MGPDGVGTDVPGSGISTASPYASIAYAITQAGSDDTIHVLNGTHSQSATLKINKELTLTGEDRMGAVIYFPSNFTASANVHAVDIASSNVTVHTLTINRQNFLNYGAVIRIPGAGWPDLQPLHDNILIRDTDIVGGHFGMSIAPKNFKLESCSITGQDAVNDLSAISISIIGYIGSVDIIENYFEGTLAGNLGGARVRRAFQIEPAVGWEKTKGTLNIRGNVIYDVREPFLWNNWVAPLVDKATVMFIHNTIDVTSKTPFTLFAFGTGAAGDEHLKFDGITVRDNLFANTGGNGIARCDYQAGNFPRNFPLGGFTFENNLLFINPIVNPVSSLSTPLATDPGWASGQEFDTNSQPASLRFDYTIDPSPFADPAHGDWNYSLNPSTPSGFAGYLSATDGSNLGAWKLPDAVLTSDSTITISWQSESNLTYQVQCTSVDNPSIWIDLGLPVTGDGSVKSVVDPVTVTGKWYRVGVTW